MVHSYEDDLQLEINSSYSPSDNLYPEADLQLEINSSYKFADNVYPPTEFYAHNVTIPPPQENDI